MWKITISFAEPSDFSNLGPAALDLIQSTDKEFEITNTPSKVKVTDKEMKLTEA